MVIKKRKSKRIPIRKREGVAKKVRERNRKKRREFRKKERTMAAPPSIFYTEEEKALLGQIRENSEQRQRLYLSMHSDKKERSLETRVEESDVVLEFVDSRDPYGSCSEEVLRLSAHMNKPHYKIYYNTSQVPAYALEPWMMHDKAFADTDVRAIEDALSSLEKDLLSVLVAANADFEEKSFTGLGLRTKLKFERVYTGSKDSPVSILRETQKLTKLNYRSCVMALVSTFSKTELLLKYQVPDFCSVDELLESIGRENGIFSEKGRVDLVKSSKWLIENIREDHLFFTDTGNNLRLVHRSVSCMPFQ